MEPAAPHPLQYSYVLIMEVNDSINTGLGGPLASGASRPHTGRHDPWPNLALLRGRRTLELNYPRLSC